MLVGRFFVSTKRTLTSDARHVEKVPWDRAKWEKVAVTPLFGKGFLSLISLVFAASRGRFAEDGCPVKSPPLKIGTQLGIFLLQHVGEAWRMRFLI
jgi:hypothetical protein